MTAAALKLPRDFDPSIVPAVVTYSQNGTRAITWHPLGDDHQNALLLRERLRRRGVAVIEMGEAAKGEIGR